MKAIAWLAGLLVLIGAAFGAFVWSGIYNVAADEPHTLIAARVLETARERSIAARASDLIAPRLDDEAMIRAGAGNYDAMCVECHLRPGLQQTELSAGLNPPSPDFSRRKVADAARAFWIIKHGIKMTGMPAWGKSMEDEYIWGMVAFVRQLPGMSEDRYRALVAASAGHSHDEDTKTHVHDDGSEHEHRN